MVEYIPKKVIIFITKSNWGGAQKYVFDIATHLPKDQFEVVVSLGGNGLLRTRLEEAGIRIIPLDGLERDVRLTQDISVFLRILKILTHEKPDIIHVNSTKISGLAALAGRLTGVHNIIFTVHGWAFNEPRGFISKSIIKSLYLLMLWLSHNVIAVSNKIVEQVQNWPFRKKTLTVIHNGIASPDFLDKHIAREKLEHVLGVTFSPDTLLVGGIGELHPIKGHIYGIQALEQLIASRPTTHISYVIIGAGETEKKLREEIKTRGLEHNVFLTGYIQDAATYIKAFDIYLFPSLSEGLPYAIVEAGFANLPVIASRVGGIPEIITSDVNGVLIPSTNPEAIHDALCKYLDNTSTFTTYAHALHEKVTQEFSVEHMIKKTVEVYRK